MSKPKTRAPFEGPIFYIHEEGDDFTFYLDASNNSISTDNGYVTINGLRLEERYFTPGTSTDTPTAKGTKKQFSFSGKVMVQDFGLTAGSFKSVDDGFWERLRNTKDDPPCKYLLDTIVKSASKRNFKNEKAVIRKIRQLKGLEDEDKKIVLSMLGVALKAVDLSDLEKQKWSKQYDLSKKEKFLKALKLTERKEWRKRFLLEKAFPEFSRTGRGLICFSHGRYLSVTFRKLSDKGYEARPNTDTKKRKTNLFSLSEYCDQIYEQVFHRTESTRNAQGLLVVTGSTNSAKSEIARGLIYKYLAEPRSEKERKRHLVTFEDPIEALFAREDVRGKQFLAVELPTNRNEVNYTPRQKGRDVGLLKEALADALRQTPTVVFVGETRVRREWEMLLDFAATGHLIVTTAHAGSLVEAMHNIFEARNVKTRAQRGEIAHKLLGVIHLKGDKVPFFTDPFFESPPGFAKKVKEEDSTGLSKYLREQFGLRLLQRCGSDRPSQAALADLLARANKLLRGPSLYEEERFKDIPLSEETKELLTRNPNGEQLICLNRMLLDDAYPDEMTSKTNVLFPALWRRTPRGVAALTGDGLSSLLPHRPGDNEAPSCVGRRWFIGKLINDASGELAQLFGANEKERLTTRVHRKATGLDLRGE